MKLPILLYLSLMWILRSQAQDHDWKININRTLNATKGSNITIMCQFYFPSTQNTNNFGVYWKTEGQSECSKNDNDKKAFAFHPILRCVDSNFRHRTKLIGNKSKGNCSLQIFNIREGEPKIYLRVTGSNDNYSFVKDPVIIYVDGQKLTSLNHTDPPFNTTATNSMSGSHDDGKKIKLYLTTFVPVLGVLVVVAAGTVAYKIRKSSYRFEREESGYYVNFRRTSSNTPIRFSLFFIL
ncbi:hypothetical protein GOODEAATRI_005202 [Goodea atripinnis]|uniref:Uncharacterized protein n=1 Tax=Goodea atripinnis TaxID=208336 RepID=A0ABV0P1K5_9TELE